LRWRRRCGFSPKALKARRVSNAARISPTFLRGNSGGHFLTHVISFVLVVAAPFSRPAPLIKADPSARRIMTARQAPRMAARSRGNTGTSPLNLCASSRRRTGRCHGRMPTYRAEVGTSTTTTCRGGPCLLRDESDGTRSGIGGSYCLQICAKIRRLTSNPIVGSHYGCESSVRAAERVTSATSGSSSANS
jgi:hypothetical protein